MSNGLHLGGGGGSTLAFDISASADIFLVNDTTGDRGFFLGSPSMTVAHDEGLSAGNALGEADTTSMLVDGRLMLLAGETYSVTVEDFGAGVEAFQSLVDFRELPTAAPFCVVPISWRAPAA